MNLLQRFTNYVRYRVKVQNKFWLKNLKYYGIPLVDIDTDNDGGIELKPLGLVLSGRDQLFVLRAYDMLRIISKNKNCSITQSQNLISISFKELSIPVDSKQEVFIFKEIFLDGTYNYEFTKPFSVIDIGFNVGMASLFFALSDNVKKIYGFEPLKPTVQKAKKVLEENSKFKNKIDLSEFGMSNEDGGFSVKYDYENKGNAGIGQTKISSDQEEEIIVRDCSPVVSKILKKEKGNSIFVKIDCEGGEYAIIDRLAESGLLKEIDVIAIEFHFHGPDALTSTLKENKFDFFVLNPESEIGMIYAFKEK